MTVDSRTVLICRCKHGSENPAEDKGELKYPHYWMESVIAEAKRLGFNVVDLDEDAFQKDNLMSILVQKQPFMVIFCGHGKRDAILGHKGQRVVNLCQDDQFLKDKIVFAVSCYTADALGKSAKNKGCKYYIGWTEGLDVPTRKKGDPKIDDYAKPCMEAVTEIPIRILNGDDIYTAYRKSRDIFNMWIEEWRSNARYGSMMASTLEEIRDGLLIDQRDPISVPPIA